MIRWVRGVDVGAYKGTSMHTYRLSVSEIVIRGERTGGLKSYWQSNNKWARERKDEYNISVHTNHCKERKLWQL